MGSVFWWVNLISKFKKKRRLMKTKLESLKMVVLKGSVDVLQQQTDVVPFSTPIIFSRRYALMSLFHSFGARKVVAMKQKRRISKNEKKFKE